MRWWKCLKLSAGLKLPRNNFEIVPCVLSGIRYNIGTTNERNSLMKIPKKEYKLEYTSLLGNRAYAYVVARTAQLAIDKLIEDVQAKDGKALEELPFDQAAYLAA